MTAAPTTVTATDRLLAGAAYLAAFAGFPLIAPIGIFFWRGKASRFVGFHAVQAILLNVTTLVFSILAVIGAMLLGSLLVVIADGQSRGAQAVTQAVAVIGIMLLYGLALGVPTVPTAWVGILAMRGRDARLPILGRWAERIAGA